MVGLFADDELFVRRDVSDYVVTGASGAVTRARWRSSGPQQPIRQVLRGLLDRHARPHTEFSIVDDEGSHRLDLVIGQGDRVNVDLTVSRPDGSLVGTVVASGGLLTVFPTLSLLDGTGTPVGRMTTRGAPQAYDVSGREMAVVVFGSTRPAFGKVVLEVTFLGNVPAQSRVLIVAALIAFDLSR